MSEVQKHKPLTKRQLEVFNAINNYVNMYGIAPTLYELCKVMGTKSVGSMHKHLCNIERRGLIFRTNGGRQIKIIPQCPYCGQTNQKNLVEEIDRLRTALSNVRHSLFASEANIGAITDTLWMAPEISMNETVQDYIDSVLETSNDSNS